MAGLMAGLITINHQPAKNDDQPEGFKGCLPLVNIQQTDGTSPCLSSVNQPPTSYFYGHG